MPEPTPTPNPNRTRDHLANERTFLAWVRTALGLIGLGFVLARMGLFIHQFAEAGALSKMKSVPVDSSHEFLVSGVMFLVLGTMLCGWSGWQYDRTRRAIDANNFEPARFLVFAITSVVVLGGLVVIGLVVLHTLGPGVM